jgi:hypothetical protein
MSMLTEKASQLRSSLPKSGGGNAPQDTGIRLATFPRPEGEWRLSWNVFEDRPYVRLQFWSKGEDGGLWPVKGQGFTIKIKELPDLAEGVQKALDRALLETKGAGEARPAYRASEGAGSPF